MSDIVADVVVPPIADPTPILADRTFSQEDVDRIVQDRLARAKATPPADYEELKAAKTELDEIKAASQTELERLQTQVAETEQRAAQATALAERQLIQAAILSEATRQNAVKPEHLHKLLDTGVVTVGDDGQVTGAEDAVKVFLEANPEYVGGRPKVGSADQGARGGGLDQLTRDDLKAMSSSEIVKAQNEGRLSEIMKGSSTP